MGTEVASIALSDLVAMTNHLANINAVYLGVAVAILGLMAGGIYIFNIKPLKEKLAKQEETLVNLKDEVKENLSSSMDKLKSELTDFEQGQIDYMSQFVEQKNEKLISEVETKIAVLETSFSKEMDKMATEKDNKLKELIMAETSKLVNDSEKSINLEVNKKAKDLSDQLEELEEKHSGTYEDVLRIKGEIIDLQIEHYRNKGQIGSVSKSIEKIEILLKRGWNPESALRDLKEEIRETGMPEFFMDNLRKMLNKLPDEYHLLKTDILQLAEEKVFKLD